MPLCYQCGYRTFRINERGKWKCRGCGSFNTMKPSAPEAAPKPPAEQPERPTCGTCPYWNKPLSGHYGNCHRHAPTPSKMDHGMVWIATKTTEWCGEHPEFSSYLAERRAAQCTGMPHQA
jgi:hypothetical protein